MARGPESIRIGGHSRAEQNVISGLPEAGILLTSGSDPYAYSDFYVTGNLIGTDAQGRVAIANQIGLDAQGVQYATVENNTISGNAVAGVRLEGNETQLIDNRIGTDALAARVLPNDGPGVLALGERDQVIQNVISGNRGPGIVIGHTQELPAVVSVRRRKKKRRVAKESSIRSFGSTRSVRMQTGSSCGAMTGRGF